MKQKFFTGLIILLPLVVTIWIVNFVIQLATGPFQAVTRSWLHETGIFTQGKFFTFSEPQVVSFVSTLCILAALTAILCLIGIVGEWFFVRWIVNLFDRILLAMPLIRKIYKSCKDFAHILFKEDSKRFSHVAWVPFPSKNQRVLGLVTNQVKLPNEDNRTYVSVLVPGTPNPTVGFLLFFPQESLEITDIPADEGMKWLISCGTSVSPTIAAHFKKRSE